MAVGRIAAAMIGLSLALQGCAYHPLTVREQNDYGTYHRVNSNAFFWGTIDPPRYADKCATGLIHGVKTVTSLPQALATVLTLGIWMPATVEYKCAKRPILPDDPEPAGGE